MPIAGIVLFAFTWKRSILYQAHDVVEFNAFSIVQFAIINNFLLNRRSDLVKAIYFYAKNNPTYNQRYANALFYMLHQMSLNAWLHAQSSRNVSVG